MDFVQQISDCINEQGSKSVALQMPDSMFCVAADLCAEIEARVAEDVLVYVLGDTSYAECCIDDVTASHAQRNDLIVKFGHSCLTTKESQFEAISANDDSYLKKVIYVVSQSKLPESVKEQILAIGKPVYLMVAFEFFECVHAMFTDVDGVSIGTISMPGIQIIPSPMNHQITEGVEMLGLKFRDNKAEALVYIGCERLFNNFIMPNVGLDLPMYFMNTETLVLDEILKKQVNKALMQRYANVTLIQEAQVIGILVGTVVVSQYAEIINYLKQVITNSGRKCYEVLVGKLNEPKLKNLPTIDLYVYVGCRETSLISSKEFMMPVATPHECFMTLLPEQFPWQCKIITDFQLLLPSLKAEEPKIPENTEESKEAFEDSLALVKVEHRELVPIFSVQVLQRYEAQTFKGLDIATQQKLQLDADEGFDRDRKQLS